jgi:acyl carrier protein
LSVYVIFTIKQRPNGTFLAIGGTTRQRTKMNEIRFKITRILTDKLALDESGLQDDLKFYSDLGVDSLDFYEVISDIERAFNINIPDEDAARLNTLGAVVAYIEKKAPQHSLLQVA